MPMISLRTHVLRLATQREDLRPALVAVLGKAGKVSLRERVLLAAAEHPEFRKKALRVLKAIGNTSVVQQAPIVIQQPPIIVQQDSNPAAPTPPTAPVAPATQSLGALFTTERTQKGFETDLLPELVRLQESGQTPEQAAGQILGLINQAFASKNHLYNILIRHQATFETDREYQEGLERLVQAWVADAADNGA